jgi:KaiC/GvpD/RAD55 family RecA-like ATPase
MDLGFELKNEKKYTTTCPKCVQDRSKASAKSLAVFRDDDGYIRWQCMHAGQCEWNTRQFIKGDKADLPATIDGDPVYWYRSSDATPLFGVRRTKHKSFLPVVRVDGEWKSGKGISFPSGKYLFGAEHLKDTKRVLVVEGEKAAQGAREVFPNTPAVSWPGGAQGTSRGDWDALTGVEKVYLWPDNDDPGRKAMQDIAEKIHGPEVWLIDTTVFPPKSDLADNLDPELVKKQVASATLIKQGFVGLHSSVEQLTSQAEELNQSLSTGYEVLDQYIRLPRSGLVVLEARTKHGKSAMAVNFSFMKLKENVPVHFFSYEMPASQVLERFARVESPDLNSIEVSHSEAWKNLAKKVGKTLFIYDPTARLSSDKLLKRLDSADLRGSVVVLDYLQRIPMGASRANRQETIRLFLDEVALLAHEHGYVVFLLSQLTADYNNPLNDSPREAQDIHFTADLILRGWYKDSGWSVHPIYDRVPGNYVIHVFLNRHGESGFQFGCVLYKGALLEPNEEVSTDLRKTKDGEKSDSPKRTAEALERIATMLESKII